ncbi:LTV1 [Cryptosporidium sp. chipmunk genotype I]|uniref:LTV1 n=1 Tax=Cryptosporidium sp. chipmunk genotype I TaxID=1280935 RepID=UPI00351A9452|nr:LTV1 [Cryptosporidium sp. chipmunk genotype I]
MGKIRNNKNVVKLRLLPSVNRADGLSPRWAPVTNREFTNDEKQGIRKIIGNVYFHDELDGTNFEDKNSGSDISLQINKVNNDLDTDIFKDNYFPDDGYDYEQHLCRINKDGNYMNSASKNKTNSDSKSILLNSTSVLPISEIDVNKDDFVSELVELVNCLEKPDDFEELNDDFILNAAGIKNKSELDKNININDILWGGGKLNSDYKDDILRLDNEFDQSELITQNFDSSSIFSEENHNNESGEDLLETVLNEYNDSISTLDENASKLCSVKLKNKLDISEYEHILDRYINQVKSRDLARRKPEKSYDEINIPLDKVQVEKIISILENTEICDNSSEVTISDFSDSESIEKVGKNFSQVNFEVVNKPNKVEISSYYSSLNLKAQEKCLPTYQKSLHESKKSSHDQHYNYNSKASIITFLPLRRKDETLEDRRNRKQAVKQAKREMRDIKRKNKQDTKNIKKSVVGTFINSNNNDIKSGVRYFRF